MKMVKPLVTVAASGAIALGTLAFPSGEVKAAEGDFDLTIMHSNDTHAHLENVPKKVSLVEQLRADRENSVLLDAGDVFSGTLFYNEFKGLADLKFMNMMEYDAMVPGNHEFDDGTEPLADFINDAEFPIVSANIDYSQDVNLKDLFKNEIGKPGEGGSIYPATILEVDGEKIGVFGLTTEETAFLSNPGDDIEFQDYLQKAEDTVTMLEGEGVNKVVALTHIGVTYDRTLAESVDGIDVVVGAHSHTAVEETEVFNNGEGDEPTLVVQAGEYNEYLGDLQVTFDDQGVLQEWDGQLIDIEASEVEPNAEAQALLEEYQKPLEDLKNEVVGETTVALNGERSDVRQGETNLGNLITDSMLAKAQKAVPETTIAIQNGGGIRASIDEGDITMGEVLTTMPFGNQLVTLELTGEQLMAALENGVSDLENMGGRFAQVSGLQYSFDRNHPAGERIVDVQTKTADGYEDLDLNGTYTIATNAFIADGGDGYASFAEAKADGKMKELFFVDYEVFNEYLSENGTVSPAEEGRILEKTRISGEDRYATAIEISKKGWEQADTVVIARGDEFADALAGAPLAYKEDAPILLTKSNKLDTRVREEIKRLGATNAIILGGTGAVSPYVKYQLEGLNLDVERISGKNRYSTAASIAARLGGNPDNVIVADGRNYPDALAVASYAAKEGYPILLSETDKLPGITKTALGGFDQSIVVGGTNAISEDVESMLPEPTRYKGATRYETAAVIAKDLMASKENAFVSTGVNFADALAGSVLAAKHDASMLLVKEDQLPQATETVIEEMGLSNFHVLGGTGAVSEEVEKELGQK
ncbi:cell wall-binding repeat-containing protein [Halobacillus sp. GSS1]|uniref:cell wall-binding repeat-containing protein n=1 Tax=Halobacillus sp. GSS1 TaxID=2815919 RepID=UPI001A8D98C5|nr:cell wall-binding repeat-containing protein [Halobacillus sp. GSS1]MBN9655014.1 cell wall-binding repeat-containing protein [Halobacillus sp. GSS1]